MRAVFFSTAAAFFLSGAVVLLWDPFSAAAAEAVASAVTSTVQPPKRPTRRPMTQAQALARWRPKFQPFTKENFWYWNMKPTDPSYYVQRLPDPTRAPDRGLPDPLAVPLPPPKVYVLTEPQDPHPNLIVMKKPDGTTVLTSSRNGYYTPEQIQQVLREKFERVHAPELPYPVYRRRRLVADSSPEARTLYDSGSEGSGVHSGRNLVETGYLTEEAMAMAFPIPVVQLAENQESLIRAGSSSSHSRDVIAVEVGGVSSGVEFISRAEDSFLNTQERPVELETLVPVEEAAFSFVRPVSSGGVPAELVVAEGVRSGVNGRVPSTDEARFQRVVAPGASDAGVNYDEAHYGFLRPGYGRGSSVVDSYQSGLSGQARSRSRREAVAEPYESKFTFIRFPARRDGGPPLLEKPERPRVESPTAAPEEAKYVLVRPNGRREQNNPDQADLPEWWRLDDSAGDDAASQQQQQPCNTYRLRGSSGESDAVPVESIWNGNTAGEPLINPTPGNRVPIHGEGDSYWLQEQGFGTLDNLSGPWAPPSSGQQGVPSSRSQGVPTNQYAAYYIRPPATADASSDVQPEIEAASSSSAPPATAAGASVPKGLFYLFRPSPGATSTTAAQLVAPTDAGR